MKKLLWATLLLTQGWAQAHEGHGMVGASHWHGTDVAGFVLAVLVVAALIWFGGKGR
jgi:hypothetical protein